MDPRNQLLGLLANYQPLDAADGGQRDKIRAFVESTPDCFERTYLAGHITGSAWVMDKSGTKVLLTHHKKLGKWLQLGGHSDGNFDVLAVARREAEEESGLSDLTVLSREIFDLDIHAIPARGNEPEHWHYDIRFLLQAKGSEQFHVSGESNQLEWVELKKLAALSDEPSLLRMARKWEARSVSRR